MSKHSKNNTSSSVFTYEQRRKLKNVYGTIQTRIGQDSVKKFQDCTICHNRFIQPTSCDHGHVFCRSCVIEYLVQQKKKNQFQNLKVEKEKNQQLIKNKEQQLKKQVQRLDKFQRLDSFLTVTERKNLVVDQVKSNSNQNDIIDLKSSIKPTGVYQQTKQRQKYLKTSFWAIQNTPDLGQKKQSKQGSQKITQCPSHGPKHKLTLKKLRDIKINQLDNVFCCWICRKQIGRQKIGCYKCGHLVCLNCKSQKCQICDTVQKWIQIQGNASSFSSHNKSQVKTYTHAFIS